jgi:hypothetical protein
VAEIDHSHVRVLEAEQQKAEEPTEIIMCARALHF